MTKGAKALRWYFAKKAHAKTKAYLDACTDDLLADWDGDPVMIQADGKAIKVSRVVVKETEIFDQVACLKDHPELKQQYRKIKKGSSYFKAS